MRRIFFLMAVMVAAFATVAAVASSAGADSFKSPTPHPWAEASASAYVCHGIVHLKVRLTNVDTIAHSATVGTHLWGSGWAGHFNAYSVTVLPGDTWTYSYSAVAHRGYKIGIDMTGVHVWEANDPIGALMLDQSASASVVP